MHLLAADLLCLLTSAVYIHEIGYNQRDLPYQQDVDTNVNREMTKNSNLRGPTVRHYIIYNIEWQDMLYVTYVKRL